jgi:hypothetical protein
MFEQSSSSSEETENEEDKQMVEHFKQKYERLNTYGNQQPLLR